MNRLIPPAALAVLILTAAPVPAQRAKAAPKEDVVAKRDGKEERGTIQKEEYDGVTIKTSSGAPTIAWEQVQSIRYADQAGVNSALDQFGEGRIDEALAALTPLKDDKKLRGPVRQQVLYHVAALLSRKGKPDEALACVRELLTEFPRSRYLAGAGNIVLEAHTAKKDLDGGAQALDRIVADAASAGIAGGLAAEIGVLKGRILEAKGDFSNARKAYAAAEGNTGIAPAVALQIRLGIGRCHKGEKNATLALTIFQELTKNESAPPQVLAGAWNGIGEITADVGVKEKSAEKLLDALYAYLRGVVQYGPAPGEPTQEHEHALKGAADCFRWLAQTEKTPDRKKSYEARYQENMERLRREYPNSPFLGR